MNWHLPSTSPRTESCGAAAGTFNTPLKEFRVESRNEASVLGEKLAG